MAETLTQSAPIARKARAALENIMMESGRKREQITTAPGLRLERLEKGTGGSCTAAGETRERTPNVLYISGTGPMCQPFGYESDEHPVFFISKPRYHWRVILSVGPASGSANDLSNEIMISSC